MTSKSLNILFLFIFSITISFFSLAGDESQFIIEVDGPEENSDISAQDTFNNLEDNLQHHIDPANKENVFAKSGLLIDGEKTQTLRIERDVNGATVYVHTKSADGKQSEINQFNFEIIKEEKGHRYLTDYSRRDYKLIDSKILGKEDLTPDLNKSKWHKKSLIQKHVNTKKEELANKEGHTYNSQQTLTELKSQITIAKEKQREFHGVEFDNNLNAMFEEPIIKFDTATDHKTKADNKLQDLKDFMGRDPKDGQTPGQFREEIGKKTGAQILFLMKNTNPEKYNEVTSYVANSLNMPEDKVWESPRGLRALASITPGIAEGLGAKTPAELPQKIAGALAKLEVSKLTDNKQLKNDLAIMTPPEVRKVIKDYLASNEYKGLKPGEQAKQRDTLNKVLALFEKKKTLEKSFKIKVDEHMGQKQGWVSWLLGMSKNGPGKSVNKSTVNKSTVKKKEKGWFSWSWGGDKEEQEAS